MVISNKYIKTIIFTKDRAMQLDALLKSMDQFGWLKICDVTVLYAYKSKEHYRGYCKVMMDYPNIDFRKDKDFRISVLDEVSNHDHPYTMFLVDDSIFLRSMPYSKDQVLSMLSGLDVQISLRMSKSMIGKSNWLMSDHPFNTDEGYPFSVDAHIYCSRAIRNVLEKDIEWRNPNSLEAHVSKYCKDNKLFNTVIVPNEQVYINFPINVVQMYENYRIPSVNEDVLLKYFMDDFSIVYDIPRKFHDPHIDLTSITISKTMSLEIPPKKDFTPEVSYD